ncbi:MAG: hypothetical protein J7485_05140 [Sphingobium sp.]|nr:hypothetical protein [Sphingobium sp.]
MNAKVMKLIAAKAAFSGQKFGAQWVIRAPLNSSSVSMDIEIITPSTLGAMITRVGHGNIVGAFG